MPLNDGRPRILKPPRIEIARTVLASEELADLRSLPTRSEQQRHFTERWCFKEAFTKGLGTGLTTPFNEICISLSNLGIYSIASEQHPANDWRLFCEWPTGKHCLAVAVSRTEVTEIEVQDVIPGKL